MTKLLDPLQWEREFLKDSSVKKCPNDGQPLQENLRGIWYCPLCGRSPSD